MKYFGKEYTITEIENLSVNERDKLYSRYEAKLRREMISSLGSSIISLYARALGSGLNLVDVMGYEFTIGDKDDLITDLEKDPFILTPLFFRLMRSILQVREIVCTNHRGANFGETFHNKKVLPRY